MKQINKRLPLAVAVLGALASQVATAQETQVAPNVTLDIINVTVDRQGAKSKTNVVTTATKDKRTETDLRGLLNEEPAINFGGGNGTSQWWTIRGMGQDQIDVKVDNAYSDTQIFHHQGRFMLDPALVKIVSVQKGAGSASAGIGATSGAIVAKTLDAKELLQNSTNENLGFKVNAGYSSNDGYNYGASVYGKAGAVDALVASNWVNNDNYKDGNGSIVGHSALDQRGLLAKVGLDVNENNRFVASYRQEYSEGIRNLREEFDDYVGNEARYRETKQETTMLEYEGKDLSFADRIDANIYQMNSSRKEIDPKTNIMGSPTEVETTGANINFDTWVNQDSLIKYGVNYRHQEAMPPTLKNDSIYGQLQNQKKTDTGIYVESINHVGDFTLTGGVRYDHFEFESMTGKTVSDGDLNPSLGLIWQIAPEFSLNANHYHATRSPRIFEPAIASGETCRNACTRRVVSIAEGTKAEKAKNTEVGFNYNNGNFSADGSYFWQTVDNALGLNPIDDGGGLTRNRDGSESPTYNEIYNGGKIKNKGYEVGLGYRFKGLIDGLSARVSVAYQEPEIYGNVTDSNTAAVWQGRTYTGSLAYQFQNAPVELGWRGRVVEDGIGNPSRASDGTPSTPQVREGYNVHDFYANWKPYGTDRMNVNFAINNAFDEYYKPHSQRANNTSLAGVGREYRVGVNFTY